MNNMAIGSVVEKSKSADTLWAEILGRMMRQLVLRVATQKKHVPYWDAYINYDNK